MKSLVTLKKLKGQSGFTLIELLVVIGILAILLAITLIAINPNKHFQDSRNTQRSSNVSEILNAIYEYESAQNGSKPAAVLSLGALPMPIAEAADQSASAVAVNAGVVTFTVASGNTLTAGNNVIVSGCSDTANNGTFPVLASSTTTSVDVTNAAGVAGSTGCTITSGINLCSLSPTYIADLPMDPNASTPTGGSTPCASGTTAYNTGYTIVQNSGRFTVAAPRAEGSPAPTISVTR